MLDTFPPQEHNTLLVEIEVDPKDRRVVGPKVDPVRVVLVDPKVVPVRVVLVDQRVILVLPALYEGWFDKDQPKADKQPD